LFDPDVCLLVIRYYIHLNPVRVGALKAAETEEGALSNALLLKRRQVLRDYEWSSYRDYPGLRRPFRWLKVEAVVSRKHLSAVGERKLR